MKHARGKLAHAATALAVLVCAGPLQAQGGNAEIGTALGVSIFSAGGETVTRIGIPGMGVGVTSVLLGAGSTLYGAFFSGPLLIQPELGFSVLSGGGETLTLIGFAGNVGYAFSGAGRSSAYVAVSPAFQFASVSGSSDSEFGAGARVGYRLLATSALVLRFEGGYRRWFDSDVNEFSFGMGIGTRLGG
jgi:hypothetical protein